MAAMLASACKNAHTLPLGSRVISLKRVSSLVCACRHAGHRPFVLLVRIAPRIKRYLRHTTIVSGRTRGFQGMRVVQQLSPQHCSAWVQWSNEMLAHTSASVHVGTLRQAASDLIACSRTALTLGGGNGLPP